MKPIRPSSKIKNAAPIGGRSPAGSLVRAKHLAPFALAALIVGFNACSGRGTDSGLVEIVEVKECSEYAAAVRACMQKLGVSDSDEQAASMKRSFSRVAKKESSREKLAQSCTESARRVRESCR